MKKFLVFAAGILCAACVTPPSEDYTRPLHFSWTLSPETVERVNETVEMGEIFFEWNAESRATHEISIAGQTYPITTGYTRFGNLYCSFGAHEKCYEDRDADGKLERSWSVIRSEFPPKTVIGADKPALLEAPITLKAITSNPPVINTGKLGLIYAGPLRGMIAPDKSLETMIGSFQVGWHAGKKEPRDPAGSGWKFANVLFAIQAPEALAELIIKEIGLRYSTSKATPDGLIDISLIAMPVENVRLDLKFDVDVEKINEVLDEMEL